MISTTAAVLGGAAIAGSVYGANKAAKASKYAANQQADAARESNALNERIFNQTRADNETRRLVGDSSLLALAGGFGLPVPRAGGQMMTGGGYPALPGAAAPYTRPPQMGGGQPLGNVPGGLRAQSPDPGPGPAPAGKEWVHGPEGYILRDIRPNVSFRDAVGGLGGGQRKTLGGFAGTSPVEPRTLAPGDVMLDHNGGPTMDPGVIDMEQQYDGSWAAPAQGGGADWQGYLDANPDVAENARQRAAAEGIDPITVAQQHYEAYGRTENRALPMNPSTGYGQAAPAGGGYSDPTSPGGYMIGARPDLGAGPGAYQAPARAEFAPLSVSYEDYEKSPEHRFRMSESQKELDRLASAGGGRFSGRRLMAGVQRAQDVASTGFTDYRNYRTGQHNLDRARADGIYSEDRGFGYGLSRDARGDFVQDRGRSDGLYADDRARADNRYDTRNATLLNLAGFGAQASGANAAAGQSWAQQSGQNAMTTANARGNAAINSANAWNQGFGNLMQTGAYLAGSGAFGGSSGGGSSGGGYINPQSDAFLLRGLY